MTKLLLPYGSAEKARQVAKVAISDGGKLAELFENLPKRGGSADQPKEIAEKRGKTLRAPS